MRPTSGLRSAEEQCQKVGLDECALMPVKVPVEEGTGDRIQCERISIAALEFFSVFIKKK